MKIHASLTQEVILEAAEESMSGMGSIGFCTACGAETSGVEPDAREYSCDVCGENAVFGAEELLLHLA